MLKEIKIKEIKQLQAVDNFDKFVNINDAAFNISGRFEGEPNEETLMGIMKSKNVKIVYEVEDEILDEQEKKYLGNLIRPFRDKVLSVMKTEYYDERAEFISIMLRDDGDVDLPNFKKGTMYKGMETNKQYTLKELGL